MIATAGIGPTYYVAATGMALAVLMFAFMRLTGPPPGGSGNVFRSTFEGLEYIRRDSVVLALIGLTFFNSVFGMSYVFLLPVFARDILQVGSEGYGLLQLVGGVGGIVGVLLAARLASSGRQGWLSIAGAFVYGVLLVGFAVSSWFGVSLVINGLISVAHQVYMTIINTVLLLIVADAYRGRVLGVYGLTWSLMPLGAAITGAVAEFAGAPAAVALGGLLIAAVSVLVGILAPRVRQLN
jgi:predicted MFS family arabinose efflux permease